MSTLQNHRKIQRLYRGQTMQFHNSYVDKGTRVKKKTHCRFIMKYVTFVYRHKGSQHNLHILTMNLSEHHRQ